MSNETTEANKNLWNIIFFDAYTCICSFKRHNQDFITRTPHLVVSDGQLSKNN